MSASHKALRILENKGYRWRQPYQAPGDYLAHLKAAVVYIPMPFRVLSRRAVAALYNPRSHDILITTAGSPLIKSLRKLRRLGRGTGASS